MRVTALPVLALTLVGCRTSAPDQARYLVTAAPFVLFASGPGTCIAIDPTDDHGVWWWHPGKSGCSSRSTGPTVFAAVHAQVTNEPKRIDVQFDVPMHSGASLHVTLTIANDSMQREPSGERVSIERRRDLDLPESCCPPSPASR